MCGLGVEPGEAVAMVGDKRDHEVCARVAQMRVVAQVPDSRAFLRTNPAGHADVRQVLANTGAKVLVLKPRAGSPPMGAPSGDWTSIKDTDYYAATLSR